MSKAEKKLKSLQASARRRGLKCTLTLEDVQRILDITRCPCCGCTMTIYSQQGAAPPKTYHTFSRRNPVLGYTRENTYATCHNCNRQRSRELSPPQGFADDIVKFRS